MVPIFQKTLGDVDEHRAAMAVIESSLSTVNMAPDDISNLDSRFVTVEKILKDRGACLVY
jgi:hypothetical protein